MEDSVNDAEWSALESSGSELPDSPAVESESTAPRILPLEGVVDVSSARALREAALTLAAEPGDVTAPCASLERLDSAAIQVLLALKGTLEARGDGLRFADFPERVARLLLQTGLAQALGIETAGDESTRPS